MSCSRTQRSASGEARARNPSISGQALYHDCAPQLGSILCGYDTCPTKYAPDLRRSILCMQGTQYSPRESILCMEHFVALQNLKIVSLSRLGVKASRFCHKYARRCYGHHNNYYMYTKICKPLVVYRF